MWELVCLPTAGCKVGLSCGCFYGFPCLFAQGGAGWLGWGVRRWAWFSVSYVQKEQVLKFPDLFLFFPLKPPNGVLWPWEIGTIPQIISPMVVDLSSKF